VCESVPINDDTLQQYAELARRQLSSTSRSLAIVNSSAGLYRISLAVSGAGGSFNIRYNRELSSVTLAIKLPVDIPASDKKSSSMLPGEADELNQPLTKSPRPAAAAASIGRGSRTPISLLNSGRIDSSSLIEEVALGEEVVSKAFAPKLVELEPSSCDFDNNSSSTVSCSNLKICLIDDSKVVFLLCSHTYMHIQHIKISVVISSSFCDWFEKKKKLICKGYEKLLLPLMNCDMEHSHVCCPKSRADVDAFLDLVLRTHADIVILDQNIDMSLSVYKLFLIYLCGVLFLCEPIIYTKCTVWCLRILITYTPLLNTFSSL
jgi:hypothetical protein